MITKSMINIFRGMSKRFASEKPIEIAIRSALQRELQPEHLEVINTAPGSEDYFKVFVVSNKFNDLSLVKRHRIVNNIIKDELKENFVHALSIEAKSPSQWDGSSIMPPDTNSQEK